MRCWRFALFIVLSQELVQHIQLIPELWKLSLAILLLGSSTTWFVVYLLDTVDVANNGFFGLYFV